MKMPSALCINSNSLSLQGSLEIFTGLGLIMGPPVGGWFYQAFGYEVPFMLLGGLLMLMVPFNMYILPTIGSSCQHGCSSRWSRKSSDRTVLCLRLCRGPFFKGFILPSSQQSKSGPYLLHDLHSQCRTGLLGCHLVTVCY